MRLFAHTNYIFRGYGPLSHEAILFEKDQAREVSEAVGEYLLGTYPLSFCCIEGDSDQRSHHCPLNGGAAQDFKRVETPTPSFVHREITEPPRNTELQVKKKRGRPRIFSRR